ncbi:DUF1566 domain-containing protein [Hydrogenophaga crassostreae]|uniref:Lcl C-terminal domain-containing protein n=1 Tax=Hydrogenophaga crassostreae TaxID=1763535 RepID=UPI0009EF57E9|nr:DUF1566 domain-containing protein [Hydrogenophaga crassostreae]
MLTKKVKTIDTIFFEEYMYPYSRNSLKLVAALSCIVFSLPAYAVCPSEPTAQRFSLNGAEVVDAATGLVWARCSIGQGWVGNGCSGTPAQYTHEQALEIAKSTNGWRLPNVKELASIIDRGCFQPAIDTVAFPSSGGVYWTSSPFNGAGGPGAWLVDFVYGYASYYIYRSLLLNIRLVRSTQ